VFLGVVFVSPSLLSLGGGLGGGGASVFFIASRRLRLLRQFWSVLEGLDWIVLQSKELSLFVCFPLLSVALLVVSCDEFS